jgi:hypothetical protein
MRATWSVSFASTNDETSDPHASGKHPSGLIVQCEATGIVPLSSSLVTTDSDIWIRGDKSSRQTGWIDLTTKFHHTVHDTTWSRCNGEVHPKRGLHPTKAARSVRTEPHIDVGRSPATVVCIHTHTIRPWPCKPRSGVSPKELWSNETCLKVSHVPICVISPVSPRRSGGESCIIQPCR